MSYAAQTPLLLAQGYEPVTSVGGLPAMGVGALRNPPGWKKKWIWTGDIVEHPADPKRKRASQQHPKLVLAQSLAHEAELRKDPAAMPAVQMPDEVKDMILDYYGSDLTPDMRIICAGRIAAREAEAQERAKKKQAQAASDAARPKKAAAPKKKGARKR